MDKLKLVDEEIYNLIKLEENRQNNFINLIASENYVDESILITAGSILTNKYAEGYPGKRYYGGCQYVDDIEKIAIERCKDLFNAHDMHVNVQPHSGSQANMAVYNAILSPGDTIMGMSLSSGGHLTHGHNVNFSGKIYNTIQYSVEPDSGLLNYDYIEELAYKYKPKLIVCGASSYSRFLNFERFYKIAKSINAYLLADIAHIAGLIVANLHPSPVNYADFITSTTHKTLRGPRSGFIISKLEYKDLIDKSIMPGIQGGPLIHIIAAKAVAFKLAQSNEFKDYQMQVIKNANIMALEFQKLGYNIVSEGTDNHLFVINLSNKGITGLQAERLLEQNGISVSRSTVPNDIQKPWITSGIRIGTPAITTRGFKEKDCINLVNNIDNILSNYINFK